MFLDYVDAFHDHAIFIGKNFQDFALLALVLTCQDDYFVITFNFCRHN